MLNVCLFEPEIPQNTGNIARTCAATGASLHLVHPLGFSISEKAVRHAGLDYWKDVDIVEYDSVDDFFLRHKDDENLLFFSTKAEKCYTDIDYGSLEGDIYLIFGKESKGIEEDILFRNREKTVRIPMIGDTRSLNLSNSVAIAVYEVLRQKRFPSFKMNGNLRKYSWEDAR